MARAICMAGAADVGVRVTRAAVNDGDAIGDCFCLLVEIIYGSHVCCTSVERFGDGLRMRGTVSDVGGFFQEERDQEYQAGCRRRTLAA